MSSLPVLDQHAAFVDVGSEHMHASIAGGAPQVFGATTHQLHALCDWLLANDVNNVAMEATGVYWLPLYSILEAAKLKVIMVNGRQTKHVPGRKTDMSDCQWGATLHAHGLLRAGFVPPEDIRCLQDYVRLRNDHISMAASHIQHMQKALERMNIKLHDVISNITGVSGLAVIRAILAGERNPLALLELCDVQIRSKKADQVKEALRGTWNEQHLFALRQALQSYEHYQNQIAACDSQIQALLPEGDDGDFPSTGKRKKGSGNAPKIANLRSAVARLCGNRDLSILPAHTEYSVLQLISEVGTDLKSWESEKHFTSWLGLAPSSNQSGKRKRRVKSSRNRAGRLFSMMAVSLSRSKDIALGGFYRRMSARRGALVANRALARKLAILFWRVMVKGLDFVEEGLARYEAQVLETKHRALRSLAKQLGQQLTPIQSKTT